MWRNDLVQPNQPVPSFRDAFDGFFAIRPEHLSNSKHGQQWQSTMRDYVFPRIGRFTEISAAEVIAVLQPICGGSETQANAQIRAHRAGRTILDVYGDQVGCGLEDTSSFSKYVVDISPLRERENWGRYDRIEDVMDRADPFPHLATAQGQGGCEGSSSPR